MFTQHVFQTRKRCILSGVVHAFADLVSRYQYIVRTYKHAFLNYLNFINIYSLVICIFIDVTARIITIPGSAVI